MNVLILGSGGREHVLATAYAKNPAVKKIIVAPGNGLIGYRSKKMLTVPLNSVTDFKEALGIVSKFKIDLVDVAGDDPLAEGFVDSFSKAGILAFGPTKSAAEIEWSKEWSRNFMKKYELPIPDFMIFKDVNGAKRFVKNSKETKFFVKASGLALGKGAIRADSKEEAMLAIDSMKNFGLSGKTFLIEKMLTGEEFSVFAICDGRNFKILGSAQDHKTVYNHDLGPNTGGMGCNSNPKVLTNKILKEIEDKVFKVVLKGMEKEGRQYKGILYLGGMLTDKGIKIIEFNARWGDPEAEVIIPSIKTDYLTLVKAVLSGNLLKTPIKKDSLIRISVAGCSIGYPKDYSRAKGKEIFGISKVLNNPNLTLFGAGIKKIGNKFFVNGGRIFHLVSSGKNIQEAREKAYSTLSSIYIEGDNLFYRTDIGWRELERQL